MKLEISLCRPTAAVPSPRVLRIASMFGIGLDEARDATIIPPTDLELLPGQIVFISGPSGGGKSSLLNLIAAQARLAPGVRVITFADVEAPDRPVIECLFPGQQDDEGFHRALDLLSRAGLADAFVLLRKPSELSDGQRHRLRLALAMAEVEASDAALNVVLADEFGATLDRATARVIARNLRRWTRRCGKSVCFVIATTHDDLLEPLDPDVVIDKGLGSAIEVARKQSSSPASV